MFHYVCFKVISFLFKNNFCTKILIVFLSHVTVMTEVTDESKNGVATGDLSKLSKSRETNWPTVLFFIHIHLLSLYGIWLLFFKVKWMTVILCEFAYFNQIIGVYVIRQMTGCNNRLQQNYQIFN